MPQQTISLFRYLLLGILGFRLYALILVLVGVAMLLSSFTANLAIINSEQVADAVLAEFLRYSLAFLALLIVVASVAEDYQSKQFERLLTMPVARWQYIAAQFLVIATLASLLVLPVLLVVGWTSSIELGLYWALALWMEIVLLGLLGLLAILSLEKIPPAVFLALSIYLLAKFSGLIEQMLTESVRLSDGSAVNRFGDMVFSAILYVLPGLDAFAQNDLLFQNSGLLDGLATQFVTVSVYAAFLLMVCLIDFYRKEFNL